MDTQRRRRRFYLITAVVFAVIIVAAVGIVAYFDYSYMSVEIYGNNNASFVLSYDSTNVTVSIAENATVDVLPHANVTLTAVVSSGYVVSGWVVSGATYRSVANDAINFVTGGGNTVITVSVELKAVPGGSG